MRAKRGDGARREQSRRYYEAHADEIRAKRRTTYHADPQKARKGAARSRASRRDAIAEQDARYRDAHRDDIHARNRRYREANAEKVAERKRRWTAANRDRVYARQREWKDANRERIRDAYLQRRYGITLTAYEALLASQSGVCAICQGPPSGRRRIYHVDHHHATGRVRGLLCDSCNLALGKLRDDPTIVQRAADYLNNDGRGRDAYDLAQLAPGARGRPAA